MGLRLQRSTSSRGDMYTCAPDWEHFTKLRRPLSSVLQECFSAELRNAFRVQSTYLELQVIRSHRRLHDDAQQAANRNPDLASFFSDLSLVAKNLESCEVDRKTGRLSLPGNSLATLRRAQYDSVLHLLDVLASSDSDRISPLSLAVDEKLHVFRVSSKARIRAISAQATRMAKKELAPTAPPRETDNPVQIGNGSNTQRLEKNVDSSGTNDNDLDDDGDEPEKTYVIHRKLSNEIFIAQTGKIVVLPENSIQSANAGDTLHLHGTAVMNTDQFVALSFAHIEICRQSTFSFVGQH